MVGSEPMIEVEKKVTLTERDLMLIEQKGTFLGSRIMTDTYFDTPDFRYTTSDIWLRERECRYELKVGIQNLGGTIDRYEEITNERKILEKLGLERKEKDLTKALLHAKIFPFATFQTVRRKYKVGDVNVDLDLAYFDDFIYRVAEIEVIVSTEGQIQSAEQTIEAFIEKMGIDKKAGVRPKLIEYLFQKNPNHYQALVASGVVQ